VRVWQHGRDARYAELAAQAAVAVRRSRWHAGTAQCHGLAGDGEFLLDLADALGEERYRDWAAELAVGLQVRHTLRAGRVVVPDEMGNDVVADFGTGLSGVVAFLLRLRHGGARLWLPGACTGGCSPGVVKRRAELGTLAPGPHGVVTAGRSLRSAISAGVGSTVTPTSRGPSGGGP
jgi:hypothetical protein